MIGWRGGGVPIDCGDDWHGFIRRHDDAPDICRKKPEERGMSPSLKSSVDILLQPDIRT